MIKNIIDGRFEWDAIKSDTITLNTSQIDQAIELSDPIPNENQQWQAYINALALLSFEQWLSDRAPDLSINNDQCSIFLPQYAGLLKSVCNLKVGTFKICLIPVSTSIDKIITLSKIATELSEYKANFYVIISIIEELEQANVLGFVPYYQLIEEIENHQLKVQFNWNYQLPLSWFNVNPDDLLLSLRCLEPESLPQQNLVTASANRLSKIREKLAQYQPQLETSEQELWQILTWEEARIFFTHPEVFPQQKSGVNSLVNVAVWLQDKLDEAAQSLSWVLLPSFNTERLNFATVMRSPIEELDDILTQLSRTGTEIPQQARGAYQNLNFKETCLRLYAVTWAVLSSENLPEWQLILILGSPGANSIPIGTRLQISDNTGILGELVRRQEIDPAYLYARVAGNWEESFFITISLINGETMTLPPFTFCP
jgi:phage-related holin